MNETASLDYAAIGGSVLAELEVLRLEKQALEADIKQMTERLFEISSREVKLARLSESLQDLLQTNHVGSKMENAPISEQSDEQIPISSKSNKSAVKEIETVAVSNESSNRNVETISDSIMEEQNREPETASENQQPETRQFNKTDFLRVYPHLKGANQPIHILAEKVLLYMNRPLKLKELTGDILELGYRHSSRNFTNSVHTVLKYKRDHSGNFYFDPKERVWKLGHWQRTTAEDASKNDLSGINSALSNSEEIEPMKKEPVGFIQKESDSRAKMKSLQRKIKIIKASDRKKILG